MNDAQLRSALAFAEPFLLHPKSEDLFANADGTIWFRTHEGTYFDDEERLTDDERRRIIGLVASMNGEVANAENPFVEATISRYNARFEGVLPPVSVSPTFAIRVRPRITRTIDSLVDGYIIDEVPAEKLIKAISDRQNILIVGGTGSGKTTLLDSFLEHISSEHADQRIGIIEDTPEVNCASPNHFALCTSKNVTMRDCVRAALRMRPDRLIVGEVRGGEALDMLKAWNTGHPGGLATLHANSANAALLRLQTLCREAADIDHSALISETVQVIVHIAYDSVKHERYVKEIANVAAEYATPQLEVWK